MTRRTLASAFYFPKNKNPASYGVFLVLKNLITLKIILAAK